MLASPPQSRPPSMKGRPLIGVLPQFRKNAPEFLLQAQRQHGDLVHLKLGPQNIYAVANPEWIRDILVTHQSNFTKSRMLQRAKVLLGEGLLTSEAEFHTRQRRLVQPAFHRDRLAGYAASMVECASACRDQWQSGVTYDIAREMNRVTLAIVARTLFSADVSSEADEIGAALTEVLGLFETVLMPFSEWIEKLPFPAVRRFERARDTLDRIIYKIIADRRAHPGDTGDLLSMLLMAQDEGSGMADKQVRDEALTLFLAGHETTANALTWTWYLLSQNPTVEAQLHTELDRVLGGRLPCFDDLTDLKYVEMVFAEAMRLFPPAWGIGRQAIAEYPMSEYVIPAKSILLMSPYVVHRDSTLVPRPGDVRPRAAFFPKPWPRVRNFPISRSAAERACVLANALRGWKACCCWPRLRSAGVCGWCRAIPWKRAP